MNAFGILGGQKRPVHGVYERASLREAAQVLDERKIGAVVVRAEDGHVCGVVSERDITRQVARLGDAALGESVASCMTRKIHTASATDSLEDLMNIMTDRRIRHLPVVEDDTLLGMISIGDVVKHKIAEAEAEAEAMHNYIAAG